MAGRGAGRHGRGGYQTPARPAAVSGPGALSARTDGRQPITPVAANREGGQHGDRQASIDQQRAAPVYAATPPPTGTTAPPSPTPVAVTPLGAPSMRPGEPVTAGLPDSPGVGPEALMGVQLTSLDRLRLIYRETLNPDLLRVIAAAEAG